MLPKLWLVLNCVFCTGVGERSFVDTSLTVKTGVVTKEVSMLV